MEKATPRKVRVTARRVLRALAPAASPAYRLGSVYALESFAPAARGALTKARRRRALRVRRTTPLSLLSLVAWLVLLSFLFFYFCQRCGGGGGGGEVWEARWMARREAYAMRVEGTSVKAHNTHVTRQLLGEAGVMEELANTFCQKPRETPQKTTA